jgi:hypothetical protein
MTKLPGIEALQAVGEELNAILHPSPPIQIEGVHSCLQLIGDIIVAASSLEESDEITPATASLLTELGIEFSAGVIESEGDREEY